jgi:thioredoxin 1
VVGRDEKPIFPYLLSAILLCAFVPCAFVFPSIKRGAGVCFSLSTMFGEVYMLIKSLITALVVASTAIAFYGCVVCEKPNAAGDGKFLLIETVKDFEEKVLKSEKPAFVYFHAEWCAACKRLALTIKEIAKEYKDKMLFVKIDVDKDDGISKKYNIPGVPAVVFISKGQEVERLVGARRKGEYIRIIEGLIK